MLRNCALAEFYSIIKVPFLLRCAGAMPSLVPTFVLLYRSFRSILCSKCAQILAKLKEA